MKMNVTCRMVGDTSRGRTLEDVAAIEFSDVEKSIVVTLANGETEQVSVTAEHVGIEFRDE